MLPEVEKYITETQAADSGYNEWYRKIHEDRPSWGTTDYTEQKYRDWQNRFDDENRKQQAELNKRKRLASTELGESTSNLMIKWMLENAKSYHGYIEQVLPILPATREELENLANESDWCSEFDGFLRRATEDGIVPPANAKNDVQEIVDWVSDEFDSYGRRYRRKIQAMVDKIVANALATQHNENVTVRESKDASPVPAHAA